MKTPNHQVVAEVIHSWKPVELIFFYPPDGYEPEIKEVCLLLEKSRNSGELARGIFQIFSDSFGKWVFGKKVSDCELVAKELVKRAF
jgi:Domain of unknown function (DUF1871)